MASNKLQKKDYTRASLRAYFLQNGMNYSNYQGLDMPTCCIRDCARFMTMMIS